MRAGVRARRRGAPRPGHADRRRAPAVPPAVEPEPAGRRRADHPARDRSREHRRHADRARRRPRPAIAPHVPAVVDLRAAGGLAVVGPRERTVGVLHGVLAQLTALHPPGRGRPAPAASTPTASATGSGPGGCRTSTPARCTSAATGARQRSEDDEALHAWLTGAHRPAPRRRRPDGPARAPLAGSSSWWTVRWTPRLTAALRGPAARGPHAGGGRLGRGPAGDRRRGPPAHRGDRRPGPSSAARPPPTRAPWWSTGCPVRRAAQFARDLAALSPATSANTLPRRVRLLDLPAGGLRLGDDGDGDGFVVAIAGPSRGHAGADRGGPRRDRSLPAGPARPGRRDHRLGQVRAAADPDRRAGAEPPAGPVLVPARRLQGRRGLRRGGRATAHRRAGHRSRRPDDRPRPALPRRRADPARGDPVGAPGLGHRRPAGRRRPRPAGHRGRRVRHPRRRAAVLRPGPGLHRPAGAFPGRPPRAGHAAARRSRLARDPGQLHAAHLPADDRRGRLARRAGHGGRRAPARRPARSRLPPDRQRRPRRAAGRAGGVLRRSGPRSGPGDPAVVLAAPGRAPGRPGRAGRGDGPRAPVPGGGPRTRHGRRAVRRTGRGGRRCPTASRPRPSTAGTPRATTDSGRSASHPAADRPGRPTGRPDPGAAGARPRRRRRVAGGGRPPQRPHHPAAHRAR